MNDSLKNLICDKYVVRDLQVYSSLFVDLISYTKESPWKEGSYYAEKKSVEFVSCGK